MISALVSGSLFRDPEQRQSKAGRPFTAGTIKSKNGDEFQFVRMVCFSESAQAELMRLHDGDAVSVQGAFKVELYRPEHGEPKLSLSIFVEQVIALRAPPKERKPKSPKPEDTRSRQERCAGAWAPGGGPNDSIPF
jgi:single-stranded DNA-binding protein